MKEQLEELIIGFAIAIPLIAVLELAWDMMKWLLNKLLGEY